MGYISIINNSFLPLTHQSILHFSFFCFFSLRITHLALTVYPKLQPLWLRPGRPSGFTLEVVTEVRKAALDWFPSEARKTKAMLHSHCSSSLWLSSEIPAPEVWEWSPIGCGCMVIWSWFRRVCCWGLILWEVETCINEMKWLERPVSVVKSTDKYPDCIPVVYSPSYHATTHNTHIPFPSEIFTKEQPT